MYDDDVYTDEEDWSRGSDTEQEQEQSAREYNRHPGSIGGGEFSLLQRLALEKNYDLAIKKHSIIRITKLARQQPSGEHSLLFSLRYSSVRNVYESSSSDLSWPGWQSLIYRAENVCRHQSVGEEDDGSAFISKFESCPVDRVGKVHWRFDTLDLADGWDCIEIGIRATLFADTIVTAELAGIDCQRCNPVYKVELEINQKNVIHKSDFKQNKPRYLDLIVTLKGGDQRTEQPWKTPQLFPQTRQESNNWPFLFRVLATV